MDADAQNGFTASLRGFADVCSQLGSPLYGALLAHAATDFAAGGPVRDLMAPHVDDPPGSVAPLRLMGAVHRLALDGRADTLAEQYALARERASQGPTAAGAGARVFADAWELFRQLLVDEPAAIAELLHRPVQTNEVGRAAALAAGFLELARRTGLPLRLLEIGSSAGLNLRWDHFYYDAGGASWGDPGSPVRLTGRYAGGSPPFDQKVEVAERRGCDPAPIDPLTDDGELTLRSYVWPDQPERIWLLEGALAIAREVPAEVEQAGASEWLARQLATPASGRCTVVFHSIIWQYLDDAERTAVLGLLDAAGERASSDAPLAHLELEPCEGGFELALTSWPGGARERLADSSPHGAGIAWLD